MLSEIPVSDWMSANVITVTSNTPIATAHRMMKKHFIRRLPVVDEGQLVGIVTIGDIREASPSDATTLSIWELNYLWAQLKIKDVMSKDVKTVRGDDPISNVAQVMLAEKVSGVPVVDASGVLIGIVTESDVFRMLVKLHAEETTRETPEV